VRGLCERIALKRTLERRDYIIGLEPLATPVAVLFQAQNEPNTVLPSWPLFKPQMDIDGKFANYELSQQRG